MLLLYLWQLAKEIGGLSTGRSQASPSAQDLADHFADKMSNGKNMVEAKYTPLDSFKIPFSKYTPPDSFKIPFLGLKIRFHDVLHMLKKVDPKSLQMVFHLAFGKPMLICLHQARPHYTVMVSKKSNIPQVGKCAESLHPTRGTQWKVLRIIDHSRFSWTFRSVLRRSCILNCRSGSHNPFLFLNSVFCKELVQVSVVAHYLSRCFQC